MSSEDRAALVALFRSTGGTRWYRNKNWDTGADLSQWYGVHVKHDGRVVELWLSSNNLEGTIPEALGVLKELKYLRFNHNKLTGPIPEALGALTELTFLELGRNKLTGPIPAWLGSQKKLRQLGLGANQLAGSIPEALGALKELTHLYLGDNKLMGSIPTWLGSLVKLEWLWLQSNHLVGHVPKELGSLKNLRTLYLHDNHLSGVIPTELANLSALSTLKYQTNAPKSVWRRRKKLTGGPKDGEGLDSWRARMRLQQKTKLRTLKGDQREEDAPVPQPPTPPVLLRPQLQKGKSDKSEEDDPVPIGSLNRKEEEVVAESAVSPQRASLSPEKAEEVDRLFRAQLVSSSGLDSLIRENPAALENIQRVIETQVAGSFYPDNELGDMQSRRNLGTLVTMSTALGEVALRHTEDMNVQRKELALPPFSKAYYTARRTGLCKAYLAASAIDSDWVSTSKTGGMGKVGAALKLMSSAVPVVGGLPELAGKTLEAGDNYLQTRRLVKITAMAPDTVECCSLARRLALQLTDGLRNDASATDDDNNQVWVGTMAGMNGGSGCGRGADMMPGDMSGEDVFEYLLEEVASYERIDHGGKRLGKKHLRKLLKAIQRGCLDGSSCTEQKMEVLLLQVLPEANIRPAATSSTPKEVVVRSPPVVAPIHDGRLPSIADFVALQAAVEALKLDKETQQIAVEELQAANDRQQEELEEQQAKIEAVESRNKQLRDQMAAMEKRVPKGDREPGDRVNAGGGQVLQQKLEIKEDLGTFWQRKETAAGAGDQGILAPAEHQAETRDTRALVDDVDVRVDFAEARLDALEQQQAGEEQGFLTTRAPPSLT